MPGPDHAALFSFLDHAAEANLIEKETTQSYKSACRTVLATLNDQERTNILALDLNEVFQRFADAPHLPPLNAKTIHTYQQRTRSAIEGFRQYHADPVNWKPGSNRRRRRQRQPNDATPPTTPPAPTPETIVHYFPLREGQFVRITGIPFDITKNEMTRMTNYLSQLVAPAEDQFQAPATAPEPDYAPLPVNEIGTEPVSDSCAPEPDP